MRRARMHARVRAWVGGRCVQRAREMCTTTIQILLLLLREQSAVNRLPRHNVSIQVRSGVLNRSAPLRSRSSKKASRKNRAKGVLRNSSPSPDIARSFHPQLVAKLQGYRSRRFSKKGGGVSFDFARVDSPLQNWTGYVQWL